MKIAKRFKHNVQIRRGWTKSYEACCEMFGAPGRRWWDYYDGRITHYFCFMTEVDAVEFKLRCG